MAQLSYNGSVVGAVSAATATRQMHESRGFVAFDDLEGIGSKRGGGEVSFGDLIQYLKLGYKKTTATRIVTDYNKDGPVGRTLRFFGVKVITNTTGADPILGSRMLAIHARRVPEHLKGEVTLARALDHEAMERIRQELHVWAFEHVQQVARTYALVAPSSTDRADEIAAPLRVMAELIGDNEVTARLEAALVRQAETKADPDDPHEVLRQVAEDLVLAGYRSISPTHVALEMLRIMGLNAGKDYTNEIPEWARSDWLGRQLRQMDILTSSAPPERPRLWPGGTQIRVYPVAETFRRQVAASHGVALEALPTEPPTPTSWCMACSSCPYAAMCSMQRTRTEWERRQSPGPSSQSQVH
jgi:hypothetical protein